MVKIINTQFNVFYPQNPAIRRRAFELEDKLREQFQAPFALLPIPDDAPPEIPRITATSKRGHSQLNISLSHAGLTTAYDDNFNHDWDKCASYITDRVDKYIPVIQELSGDHFLYAGLVINAELPIEQEPVQFLIDKFIRWQSSERPFDALLKLTFVVDKLYYVNITLSNTREYEGATSPDMYTPAYLTLRSEGIWLQLDINDRYGFNYKRGYRSGRDRQKHLLTLGTAVLNERLGEIIEKGEFSI